MKALAASALLGLTIAAPVWTQQLTGVNARLRGISAVSDRIAWASGSAGTILRTTNGGDEWTRIAAPPGAEQLDFRDIDALSSNLAYILSIGNGELSRIYKTTNGGASWQLQFTSHEPKAFYDCMAFWDADHGIAMSDEVGGHFPIIATSDGGQSWNPIDPAALPAALSGEGSFAASGSCVATRAPGMAWIGTGNTSAARVLRTTDRGLSWEVAVTPLPAAEGVGLASVAFRDDRHGVAMGGSMMDTSSRADDIAITSDGGRSWTAVGRAPFPSAIYGGAYVPGAATPTIVAVGPGGAAASLDEGRSWIAIDTVAYWSVGFATPDAGWAVGPGGRITKFTMTR